MLRFTPVMMRSPTRRIMFSTFVNNGESKAKRLGTAFSNLIVYRQLGYEVKPSRLLWKLQMAGKLGDVHAAKKIVNQLTFESALNQAVQKSNRRSWIKTLGAWGLLFYFVYLDEVEDRFHNFWDIVEVARKRYEYGVGPDHFYNIAEPWFRVHGIFSSGGDMTLEEGLQMAQGNLERLKGQLDQLETRTIWLCLRKTWTEKVREHLTGKGTPPRRDYRWLEMKRKEVADSEYVVNELKKEILNAGRH
jgi:hypothetical protein